MRQFQLGEAEARILSREARRLGRWLGRPVPPKELLAALARRAGWLQDQGHSREELDILLRGTLAG